MGNVDNLLSVSLVRPNKRLVDVVKESVRFHFPILASTTYHLITKFNPPGFIISGLCSSRPLKMRFNGPLTAARFYAGSIFDSAAVQSTHAVMPDTQAVEPDIIMEERPYRGAESGTIIVPTMVRSILGMPPSPSDYFSALEHTATSDIRKIEKENLSLEISHDPIDLFLFYHSMYLPMLASRHTQFSVPLDYPQSERSFQNGCLLLIKKGCHCLGGGLMTEYEGALRLRIMGILGGSSALTKKGVNAAILYHSIKKAMEMRRNLDMGYSSPFNSDGVFRFKNKWKARPVADAGAAVLYLRFRNDEIKRFFIASMRPILLDSVEQERAPCL